MGSISALTPEEVERIRDSVIAAARRAEGYSHFLLLNR